MGYYKELLSERSSGHGSMGMRIKQAIFQSDRVLRAMDRAKANAMKGWGAYVRRVAQNSIAFRRQPAPPGHAPHGHGAQLLRRFIFWAVDPGPKTVVVGPARFAATSGDVTDVLEHGGWIQDRRDGRRVFVAARPFMAPAAEKSMSKLPAIWRDSVK